MVAINVIEKTYSLRSTQNMFVLTSTVIRAIQCFKIWREKMQNKTVKKCPRELNTSDIGQVISDSFLIPKLIRK